MTENDIRGYATTLEQAVKANNQEVACAAGLALLVGFLTDVNRIANAAEILASEALKLGNPLRVAPGS